MREKRLMPIKIGLTAARQADDQPVRRRDRGGGADLPRDRNLVAMRVEHAGGGEGARGRAADAGIAVNHQRRAAVPAAHEIQHLLDMLTRRRQKAVHVLGDVVHLDSEMIGLKHRLRPLHLSDVGHHGQDMAGAGGLDGVGKRGERANVNHGGPSGRADYSTAGVGWAKALFAPCPPQKT